MKGTREISRVVCGDNYVALMHDPPQMGDSMEPPLNLDTIYWAHCGNLRTGERLEETRRISEVVEWFAKGLTPTELAKQLRGKEAEFAHVLAELGGLGAVAGLPRHRFVEVERTFGVPEASLAAHIEGDAIVFAATSYTLDLDASLAEYSVSLSTGLVTVKRRFDEIPRYSK